MASAMGEKQGFKRWGRELTCGFVGGLPAATARHLTPSASRRGTEVSRAAGGRQVNKIKNKIKNKINRQGVGKGVWLRGACGT